MNTTAKTAAAAMPAMTIGTNLRVTEEGDDIVIRLNKTERHGQSGSGKTTIVASSKGNVTLPNGITLGINAYVRKTS